MAARANQTVKDQKSKARREQAWQARGRLAQTKGWLTALKTRAAFDWMARKLDNIEASRESPQVVYN